MPRVSSGFGQDVRFRSSFGFRMCMSSVRGLDLGGGKLMSTCTLRKLVQLEELAWSVRMPLLRI